MTFSFPRNQFEYIACCQCGVPALAQVEDRPMCLHCLLACPGAADVQSFQQKISPLHLGPQLPIPAQPIPSV